MAQPCDGHDIAAHSLASRQRHGKLTDPGSRCEIVLEKRCEDRGRLVDPGARCWHDRGQALLDYVRRTAQRSADLRTRSDAAASISRRWRTTQSSGRSAGLRIPTRRDIDRINERWTGSRSQIKRAGAVGAATTRSRKRKAARDRGMMTTLPSIDRSLAGHACRRDLLRHHIGDRGQPVRVTDHRDGHGATTTTPSIETPPPV